ncbi:MAG: hypothetical protein CSA72_06255 [Rhodobacterales bacterium]|nr:MAG: hypothetical protein CSA72_06255 [Rhodobacterales bacterium]
MLWSAWWVWAVAALASGILEMLVPGYFFLGFAVGAAVVALGLAAGLGPFSLPILLVIFAVLSLIAFLALRRVFPDSSGSVKIWTDDINDG